MGRVSYLRLPHLSGDQLCFVAEDDLWLASLDGPGRAWRLTVDRTKAGPPRFSPDGRHIAYTSWRSLVPEVHLVPVDGGPGRQLTHWGGLDTRVCGWSPPDPDGTTAVLAVASHGEPFSHLTWAYKVTPDGAPGRKLPWGPVTDIQAADLDGERRTLLLTGTPPHEPAAWKRYRGGATGRLWLHGERLLPDLGGHLAAPMFVGGRVAFLSDHEGVGNLYSCAPDGTDLRRHTDHDAFYARNAASDGSRVVYQCAGDLWIVDDLAPGSAPRRIDVRLSGPRAGRRTYQVPAAQHVGGVSVDETGRASAVVVRGSLYWLTHRDGPARTIADTPGVRVRLPEMLGESGRIAYVTDAEGEDAVEIAYLPRATGGRATRRLASGRLGRVLELVSDPAGERLAVASHDGRLLILDVAEPDTEVALALDAVDAGYPGDAGDAGYLADEDATGTTARADTAPDAPAEDTDAGGTGTPGDGTAPGDGTPGSHPTPGGTAGSDTAGGGTTARGTAGSAPADRSTAPGAPGAGAPRDPGPGPGPTAADTGTPSGPGVPPTAGGTGTDVPGVGTDAGGAVPPGDPGTPATAGGRVTELIRSVNGPVRDLAFSPDGTWLTWSHPGIGRTLRQIKMARIDGPEGTLVVDVTNGRFEDENPVFTRDGRYLAFLSWRGFDPVYDVHTGDLSFPLGCRPYLVPLSSATPSPFALNPEGRPAAGGLDPLEDEPGEGGAVTVEVEGLENRVTPFPVSASKYSALEPVAGGGLVWLRWPISGALGETFANPADPSERPTLEHFNLAKAKKSELVDHLDWFRVSGDGSRLVVLDEGELRAVPATEVGDGDSTTWIDLRRILHEVDPAAEWRQAYDEAGRLIRAYFWDPGMCGIDWDAVLDQYRPLLERVASPDEFADLLREVLGELGTSHAYVVAARRNEGPAHYQRWQGLLGANFVCRDGQWVAKRILPGDSSDSKARSPLAGTGIRDGAVLTHVDGRTIDPVLGPSPLLAGAGGTTVELTFAPAEGCQGPSRRVAVVPLVDERPLRYQDWVAKRREVVRELSGGRCGYLHIPDMGGSGWAQFNRDLRMEVSRPALIVDVRGNAGGHISELVIEKLTRTILGWDLTRDAQPVSYTSNAPRGPVVAVADEATSSDGDMITAAFKLLRLGPVVGQRTWGGVVGMTGRHRLGDGSVITVPMNAAWFDAYGWSVENYGVAPDVEALRTPLDWAEGRYPVLDEAVRLALELLETNPPATPPGYDAVPDRSRPPLPPRE
ncbi:PDZ domain-containing protein [Streptomyces sp. RK23]|uniref:S41 family peptidase n=1 Tax=unclassified Streptomyces TaxID=2593676 RepID=UPI001B35A958|nr:MULTISPECIES: S41 family peptidase [unclassified Streptomyces]MBQ0966399.1 PDZ domain-containing protein [Streptomyces sp. RK74B]MBQ1004473.1 PDZ domain-containing protein [Streptomyces sp. RK23]